MRNSENYSLGFAGGFVILISILGLAGCTISMSGGDLSFITGINSADAPPKESRAGDSGGKRAGDSASASRDVIGHGWSTSGVGLGGTCSALVSAPDGTLYAGGEFKTAGGGSANGIAEWDGSRWSSVGAGVDGSVYTLALAPDESLYAGGKFNTAGGAVVNNIARWKGTEWSGLGSGVDGEVRALALAPDGTLYAGGISSTAGGNRVNNAAKWNGTTWSTLGTGIGGKNDGTTVLALTVASDGTVYAGGEFAKAGGKKVRNIAKWSGSSWFYLGGGVTVYKWERVQALTLASDGTLYVGGHFEHLGKIKQNDFVFNLAKWTGSAWSSVSEDGVRNDVTALLVVPTGNLFLATDFDIGVWNGSEWGLLGEGARIVLDQSSGITTMALSPNGTLYIGGGFINAGGTYEGNGRVGTVKGGRSVNYIMKWSDSPQAAVPRNASKVELYTTSWCPYRKKAKDFLRSKGVAFVEYDVEKDLSADRRKIQMGGGTGVPFAVINGQKIQGFSEASYLKALGSQ